MNKKVKTIIIIVIIIFIVIAILAYIGSNSASSPASTTAATGLSSSAVTTATIPVSDSTTTDDSSSDFSGQLSSINSINLDTSLFSNPGYKALVDNPVTLGTAVIGRQNPFAPIGTDAGGDQPAPALQVQTLAPGKIISNSAEFGALGSASSTTTRVSVVFQYGTSDTLNSATAPVTVANSGTALFTTTGLAPSTTYYVEAVAVQGSVTATGTIMSFTTTAGPQSKQ